MLWKCYTQCHKCGKLSSGHRTGKGQFSFKFQRNFKYQRMFKLSYSCAHFTASNFMLKILQARLRQCVNWELPDVQTGFRKGRGTRNQVATIHLITEKAREFQKKKKIYLCFTEYAKVFDCVDHKKIVKNSLRIGYTRPFYLSPEKPVCSSRSNS